MKRIGWVVRLASAAALFAAGLLTGLSAAPSGDRPYRTEQKRADLSGAPGMEVIASFVELKPGETADVHFHHGVEAAYIIQGGQVQPPGKDPITLATGGTVMNLREVKHGGFKVLGDAPLKLFTVHVVDKGKPLYDTAGN